LNRISKLTPQDGICQLFMAGAFSSGLAISWLDPSISDSCTLYACGIHFALLRNGVQISFCEDKVMKKMILSVGFILFTLTLASHAAQGQSPTAGSGSEDRKGAVEVRGTFGGSYFLDAPTHFVGGGAVRFYLTRRLSFEPELLYMRGSKSDQDLVFTANLSLDFATSKRVKPYVIGGVGFLHHRELTGAGTFTATGWSGSGGVGVKVFLTEKLFIAPEARVGWEPLFRVTGSIGYRF
jgi:hypothetical protein